MTDAKEFPRVEKKGLQADAHSRLSIVTFG
jgi:hypothetical protein